MFFKVKKIYTEQIKKAFIVISLMQMCKQKSKRIIHIHAKV